VAGKSDEYDLELDWDELGGSLPPPRQELPTLLDHDADVRAVMTAIDTMDEGWGDPSEDVGRVTAFEPTPVLEENRATLPPPDPGYFEDARLKSRRESHVTILESEPPPPAPPELPTIIPGPSSMPLTRRMTPELSVSEEEMDVEIEIDHHRSITPSGGMPEVRHRPTPVPDALSNEQEMIQRFESGDYGSALLRAESILEREPANEIAQRYQTASQEMLAQLYLSRIGDPEDLVDVLVSPAEIKDLPLDHRAGYLLAQIDGTATLAELVDVSSMPALETARLLHELHTQGVIGVTPTRRR